MQFPASRSSKVSVAAAATVALVATTASASMLSKRADCGVYTIISTRGTDEVQGPSRAFTTAVRETLANVPGGVEYDTVYPADFFQQSEPGTLDILNKISTTLEQCPTHKFALLGYSQGATATTEALVRMANDTKMFDSVTACIMVGNPRHNKGLKSNYDVTGGKSTEESFGLLSYLPGIPERWDDSGKVADVCADGDGVCDAAANTGVGPAHFSYINSTWVQSKAADLMTDGFKAAAASSSSSASATQTSTSAGGSSTSASSPTGTGRPQSDAAMSSLAGSAPAFAVVAAAVSFGALLTIF